VERRALTRIAVDDEVHVGQALDDNRPQAIVDLGQQRLQLADVEARWHVS
jgi:hypothetical protein